MNNMKVIEQTAYKVEYCTSYSSNEYELVVADSLIEAIEISKAYHAKTDKFRIKGVHEYMSVLKPVSKSKTVTIDIEL